MYKVLEIFITYLLESQTLPQKVYEKQVFNVL